MLSIGEFSKAAGLPVKTLRFYHEKGVLIPARVEANGYRYYDNRNLEAAQVIVALRALEFPLDDIASLLSNCSSDEDVLEHLTARREEVARRIQEQTDILSRIDMALEREREARMNFASTASSIEEKKLDPVLIAGLRMKGKYPEMGKAFGKLGRKLGRKIAGSAMCLYHDREHREEDADFEPCFPISKQVDVPEFSVRQLPGGRAITLIHVGPYEELGRSYAKLFEHADKQQLTLMCPSREVYLKGPGAFFKGDPQKYVTEIQFLIDETA